MQRDLEKKGLKAAKLQFREVLGNVYGKKRKR